MSIAITAEELGHVELVSFVQHYGIEVLNVAGPRQSKAPHAHAYAHAVINLLLQDHTTFSLSDPSNVK